MMLTNTLLRRSRHVLWLAAVLAAGCDANHVIGQVDAGSPPSTGVAGGSGGSFGNSVAGSGGGGVSSDGGSPLPDASSAPEVGPLGPSQSWTGYIENSPFPSGSDVIKLTFATDSAGNVVGTSTFGVGTPPPPATDPNVGYPVGVFSTGTGFSSYEAYLAEGYSYVISQGTLISHRLKITVPLGQLWAGWCALQSPPPDSSGLSGCLPNWAGGSTNSGNCYQVQPATHAHVPVDCAKVNLCDIDPVCLCSASGCVVREPADLVTFDVFLSSGTASGSVQSAVLRGNVHFVEDTAGETPDAGVGQ